jgi:hypothetical protein
MPRRKSTSAVLRTLRYGHVYCEICRETISVGQRVAWGLVPGKGGRNRNTAYCANCHALASGSAAGGMSRTYTLEAKSVAGRCANSPGPDTEARLHVSSQG